MRRFVSLLLFSALAVPASLAVSHRGGVGTGESCAISCGHAAGEACCCRPDQGNASMKRCDTERDLFVPALGTKLVLSGAVWGLRPPSPSGPLESAESSPPASAPQSLPDPVPRLFS